jgi:hypothetical protein
MDDDFDYALVDRAPVHSLSLKRRSAGLTVLNVLHRKKNLRVAAVLLAGLLDRDDSSDSNSDSDDEDEDEVDGDVEKDDMLEVVSYVFLKKVVTIDKPLRICITHLAKKEITVNIYSDDECWSKLRYRTPDMRRMIDLLGMPPHLHSVYRHSFTKEFSFILLLRRMAYPGHDLEQEFGREHTALSRSLI